MIDSFADVTLDFRLISINLFVRNRMSKVSWLERVKSSKFSLFSKFIAVFNENFGVKPIQFLVWYALNAEKVNFYMI